MKKTIYIRVDGNEIIATGHVMRCLSIAEALRSMSAEVVFLIADDRPSELIQSKGFLIEVLNSVWNDLNQEEELLCRYLKEHSANVLLLDSYYVTPEYLRKLAQVTSVVYIDDLNQFIYPVHTVINYGKWYEKCQYVERYLSSGNKTNFLLGCQYVPLRDEFASVPYELRKEVKSVLITVGGTDSMNITGKLLEHLLANNKLAGLKYHVIIGCFNVNKEELYNLSNQFSNLELHENVTNMAEWMRLCDVAISAAGSTLYELCACGIPTICFEIADNQNGACLWEEDGLMYYAGNAVKDTTVCIKICEEKLIKYINDIIIRKERSKKQRTLVDGMGAKRIAEYLLQF